jgi:endonuclease YncB( thermonuclease family)
MLTKFCCCFSRNKNDNANISANDYTYDYETLRTKKIQKELNMIEYNDTEAFTFPIDYGKVIKVYDGDTITICSKLPYDDSPIYRFQVRLAGIDSPEIKSHTDTEKQKAIEARDALSSLIMGKFVSLKNVKNEKFGRILADVFCRGIHVNEWMLIHNYAVRYDGGTKIRPSDWD